MIRIPAAYRRRGGIERARALDADLADRYAEYTTVADPLADAAIESISHMPQAEVHRLVEACMERDGEALASAPDALVALFDALNEAPAWFDPGAELPGQRAFHRYSDLFIPAFFVVTLQNAATLISKAFYMTGRVTTEHGLRRIRQNTRHLIEIMLPGALDREGEGWRLSVRIRLVHAQVRRLLRESGGWDEDELGAPISSAHVALSAANFSATMIKQATRLGARMNAEERAGFMQTWRYASWLIGTPEDMLFEGDEARTNHLHVVATAFEPPPNDESAVIANALVNAVPLVAGVESADERDEMALYVYRVARALLGDEVSDMLDFPKQRTTGVLPYLRARRTLYGWIHRIAPRLADKYRGKNFEFLINAAGLEDLSYRLPDQLDARKASPW